MASKTNSLKRKHNISAKNKEIVSQTKDEDELNEEIQDVQENYLVSINDESDDSTDSEGEIEESDTEEDDDEGFKNVTGTGEENSDDSIDSEVETDEEDDEDSEDIEDSDDEIESEEVEESENNESLDVSSELGISKTESVIDDILNLKIGKKVIENKQSKQKEKNKSEVKLKVKSNDDKIDKKETTKTEKSEDADEYKYDSSDEEDIRNTVGNIPKHWYDEYPHLGYTQTGERVMKPPTGDQLDEFLRRVEDPDFWRTVKDPQTGQEVVLGEEELEIIRRIRNQNIPDANFDEYAPWVEWFTSVVMETPIRKFPDHKRSFLPSKDEARKVSKLVHALKMGWIKTRKEAARERKKKDKQFYMLWQTDDTAEDMRRIYKHIPAPKRHLPGHAESYNPPAEYLFDEREIKQWKKLQETPWKRKLHFIPRKYNSLRQVPAYKNYIRERFVRCLDLFLCPRAIKMRLNIEPEALVPKLPSPRDLQPFPTTLSVEYKGHKDMVRCMSCDLVGQYLITGSDDETVKIWEINTGRCLATIAMGDVVRAIAWCPNAALSVVAVATGNNIYIINPGVGDKLIISKTDLLLDPPENFTEDSDKVSQRVHSTVQWQFPEKTSTEYIQQRIRIKIQHFKAVTQLAWHGRGDYLASVIPDGQSRSVVVSQISQRKSQLPFTKNKGLIQCVIWHPIRPYLFVATQRHIRIYDLVNQTLIKKLMSNSKWISSMAIHSGGDNLLVGTYDRKVLWFDLDLSVQPYQQLRIHGQAVRSVAYHRRYPLFASVSDDQSLIICHGMVYHDLLQNPLIVPLKRFKDHEEYNEFGIFDVMFHPSQPWVFSAGADGVIKMYS